MVKEKVLRVEKINPQLNIRNNMSHQHRKLGESIRTAHYLKQVLISEAKNSEYSRGVYNGFELISSILLNTEAKLILKEELEDLKQEIFKDAK